MSGAMGGYGGYGGGPVAANHNLGMNYNPNQKGNLPGQNNTPAFNANSAMNMNINADFMSGGPLSPSSNGTMNRHISIPNTNFGTLNGLPTGPPSQERSPRG